MKTETFELDILLIKVSVWFTKQNIVKLVIVQSIYQSIYLSIYLYIFYNSYCFRSLDIDMIG